MTRILMLIKGLGPGGAEQLLVNAAPYLDRSRFSYEVAYLLPWKDAHVGDLEKANLPVHCLNGGRSLGWIGRLESLLRRRRIELVHVHSPYAAIGARLLLLGRRRPYLVCTEHNGWERYHRATYWGNALTYPRNDHVFAVSQQVHSSVRYPRPLRWLRMPSVETLYHGPDPAVVATWRSDGLIRQELGLPADAPVVGTVANFKAHKGYPILLRAAARVRRELPDVRFLLIGQGPLELETRQLAHKLGLDKTAIFTGYREDVPRLVATIDVFALASWHEGLSIALIEAMALGKAPVVTRAGGLPEVVQDGTSGLVVPPGDPSALARAILSLLGDRELRERLRRAACRRAADFDIRHAVRRIEEVYEQLLT